MATDDQPASTAHEHNPTRGRWWLVAAALLPQFSIGAVYAWSVFSKALSAAEPFHLSKLEASLPFGSRQPCLGVGPATEPFRTLRRFGEVRAGC
jgi:hypothetical protein